MSEFNFLNLIHLKNPTIIDKKRNSVLISFETRINTDSEEQLIGVTCFLFSLDNDVVQKWIHKEIDFREGIPFIDPCFSASLHHFLKSKNFDMVSTHPLEVFLSTQIKHIAVLNLVRCFHTQKET